jgi:DNA-binding NtrC family response regulator
MMGPRFSIDSPKLGTRAQVERRVVHITAPGTPAVFRAREGVIRIGREQDNDVVIEDSFVSRHHLEVRIEPTRVVVCDLGTRNGTYHDGRPVRELPIDGEALILLGSQIAIRIEVARETQPVRIERSSLLGKSAAMDRVRTLVSRAAATNLTVLVEGDAGTGKEFVARALHAESSRARGPFVVFDCTSLSADDLANELFGAAAGREGAFRRAQGGTLFLDGIDELPLDLQPAVLRALESREIRSVGGDYYMPIDVRVIAGTRRSLEREVAAGNFRRDLMFRLAVARIRVPALAQRTEDIPTLAQHFASRLGSKLAPEFVAELTRRTFTANVRELRSVVETAVLVAGPGQVVTNMGNASSREPDDTDSMTAQISREQIASWSANMQTEEPPMDFHAAKQIAVDAFERDYLARLLNACSYNLSEASRRAGVDRGHLRELCRKHDMDPARLRAERSSAKAS